MQDTIVKITKGLVGTGASIGIGVATPPTTPNEPIVVTIIKLLVMAAPTIITAWHLRGQRRQNRKNLE